MGIGAADMEKPKVAVVNSSSQLSVCYQHLDALSRLVQEAIREAGGLPFEIRTAAPSDFVTSAGREGRYLMPTRDLIVNDIEVMVEGAQLDGMVCLASCDKTTPAHLMAAGRLDLPTIVVIGGYQVGGWCRGEFVDIDDVYESVGNVVAGGMSVEALEEMTEHAIHGPGVCAGLGTANTMHMLCEALGMTLPGSSPVRAGSERMQELARRAGARVVQLIEEGLRPRTVLTSDAFENAVMVDLAVGGSINSARHLQAIAVEAEVDIDVFALFGELADRIPLLCGVRPNGIYRTEHLEAAGGAAAVMRRLLPHLHADALTVSGQRLSSLLEQIEVKDSEVVSPLERPFSRRPGLVLVRGSLAPEGALVKLAAVPAERVRFRGPARVFESERSAIAALRSPDGIRQGDVVVLRGLGPKGGPGTVFAAGFVAALNGARLSPHVAVVTDGELSGLNRGLTVGQVMPEAAEGGPLALVQEADQVAIDLEARTVELEVPAEELARRRAGWKAPSHEGERGWLGMYARLVEPLSRGAVLRR